MFSIKCSNCGFEEMVICSFAKAVDRYKNYPQAECHYWLCKFVCPVCCFVETVPIAKYLGDRFFRTKMNLTMWHFFVQKGKNNR